MYKVRRQQQESIIKMSDAAALCENILPTIFLESWLLNFRFLNDFEIMENTRADVRQLCRPADEIFQKLFGTK